MSKWMSKSTGLESKEQLKAHRRHQLQDKLADANLDLMMYPFWSQAEKDKELLLFAEVDSIYETRKADLKSKVSSLTGQERSDYFKDIGVTEDLDIYLSPS